MVFTETYEVGSEVPWGQWYHSFSMELEGIGPSRPGVMAKRVLQD
jgi:hypothetical protein